jgi:UDP-2,4-diacetamido-2,4,6-trideoxy-beta-L-altropyranose hydrolase
VYVTFRADASVHIGTGHLVRCLALADAIRNRGGECRFLCSEVTESMAHVIESHGHALQRLGEGGAPLRPGALSPEEDARATLVALEEPCEWLVVDHYALDAAWESRVRGSAHRILAIDDMAERRHDCDMLLDQNIQEDGPARYAARVPEHCQLLLGPRYALLRDEFAARRQLLQPRAGPVRRLLVCFGGADADNHTTLALEALRSLATRDFAVDVLIGAEHPHRGELETLCRRERFELHVQSLEVAAMLAAADLAVGAGGSMTWERCCLGVPALVLATAANQAPVVRAAAVAGVLCALPPGRPEGRELTLHLQALLENELLRESISRVAMMLVDGHGAYRVARSLGGGIAIDMRPAVAEDAANLFEWRNHPSVRGASRSMRAIDWTGHNRWLASVLHSPARLLLIAEHGGNPVGVVRFDLAEERAEVSIYMVPGHDPAVRGADVLAAAERWLAHDRPQVLELRAEVLGTNAASHRLFAGAGYERISTVYTKRVSK